MKNNELINAIQSYTSSLNIVKKVLMENLEKLDNDVKEILLNYGIKDLNAYKNKVSSISSFKNRVLTTFDNGRLTVESKSYIMHRGMVYLISYVEEAKLLGLEVRIAEHLPNLNIWDLGSFKIVEITNKDLNIVTIKDLMSRGYTLLDEDLTDGTVYFVLKEKLPLYKSLGKIFTQILGNKNLRDEYFDVIPYGDL